MGHLINPIAVRLSVNTFWNSNWVLFNNFNYNNLFKKDFILYQYLDWFIRKKHLLFHNFIISHYKIYRIHNKIFINLYYYTAEMEEQKYHLHIKYILRAVLDRYKKYSWARRYYKTRTKITKNLEYPKNYRSLYNKNYRNYGNKIRRIYKYLCKFVISYLFFYSFNVQLDYYLKKLDKTQNNYFFNVYNLNFWNVSADIIATYIACRLQQRYSLKWVLKPVLKDLTKKVKNKTFLGYKLLCAGRFTRRQIATYMWSKEGSLCLNTFTDLIKYSQARVRLKFGIGGIKLWIHYGMNNNTVRSRLVSLVFPRYLPFRFNFFFKEKKLVFFFNYWAFIYIKLFFLKKKKIYIYLNLNKLKIYSIILYLKNCLNLFIKDNKFIVYDVVSLTNNRVSVKFKKIPTVTSFKKIKNKNLFKKFYEHIYTKKI